MGRKFFPEGEILRLAQREAGLDFDRIVVDADGSRAPSLVEAAQWEAVGERKAAAFVCAGESCSLPVWDEAGLQATFRDFDAAGL